MVLALDIVIVVRGVEESAPESGALPNLWPVGSVLIANGWLSEALEGSLLRSPDTYAFSPWVSLYSPSALTIEMAV